MVQSIHNELVLMHNAKQSRVYYHNREDTHDTMENKERMAPADISPERIARKLPQG